MSLPICPVFLPSDLEALILSFGEAWARSPLRPSPAPETIDHWASFLSAWAEAFDLPLLVRKHRNNRGTEVVHPTGRRIVPTDNSAAHWAYTLASEGVKPSLDDVRLWLSQDEIPMVMIQKAIERPTAKYHCSLSKRFDVNSRGWKLAHVQPVGLNTRQDLLSIPIERLQSQFVNLLSPSNMFVVPLEWAGIAEVPSVINAIASFQRPAVNSR